jgi:hypothetical protein
MGLCLLFIFCLLMSEIVCYKETRMQRSLIALLLAASMAAGCASIVHQRPSPSAGVEKMDENECAAKQIRFCIAAVWVKLKWQLNLLKYHVKPSSSEASPG